MSQKEIIIHCGFNKTASSSIQHTLGRNRKKLEKLGFYYPEFRIKGEQFYNLSIPIFGFFTEKPEDFPHYHFHHNVDYRYVNNLILDILKNEIPTHNKVIISDEFISHLSRNSLIEMKQMFEEMGFTIKVIAFLREPFNLAISTIQQRVTYKSSINDVIEHISRGNRVVKKVENLLGVFESAIEFHCFEKACEFAGGPVAYFLNLLEIKQENIVIETINESKSMQAIRLISYINEYSPLYIKKGEFNFIRQKGDIYPLFAINGDKFSITNEELNVIKPMAVRERKLLSQILGDDFFKPVKYRSTSEWKWSEEQVGQLLTIIPILNRNLRLKIYDYFYDSYSRSQSVSYKQLKSIGHAIEQKSLLQLVRLNIFNLQHRIKKMVKRRLSLFSVNSKTKADNDIKEKKNKFKKVILHVGPDKTGSTSIQSAFHISRTLLMENNIYYAPGKVHPTIGSFFCSEPERYVYNTLHRPEKTREEIRAEDDEFLGKISKNLYKIDADVLVLSSEALVYLDEKALKRLHGYLTNFCDSFEVVMYVRSPLSYATSAMSQRVRSGTRAWSALHPPILPYRDFLEKFVNVFGRNQVNLRVFSKQSLIQGDVVIDFLSLFNLPSAIQQQVAANSVRENAALSEESIQVGDRIISLLNGYIQKGSNFRIRIGHALTKIQGRKIQLTAEQQAIILKQSSPHMFYLAKEFGIELAAEVYKPYTSLSLSPDVIDNTARQLMRELVPEFKINSDEAHNKELKNIRQDDFEKTLVSLTLSKLNVLLMSYPKTRLMAKSLLIKVESCLQRALKFNKR